MKVSVKRIYDPPAKDDGVRILVDRLWPRGIAKARAKLDLWLKEIAPSDALRKRFHGHPEDWAAFKRAYVAELKAPDAKAAIKGPAPPHARRSRDLAVRREGRRTQQRRGLARLAETEQEMTAVAASVLDAIGNTPLVQLRCVVPPNCARILVKLEGISDRQHEGPHGAIYDRPRRSRRPAEAGRHHRRIYRRLDGPRCSGRRSQGLSPEDRELQGLQRGEADPDGSLRRRAHAGRKRRRPHYPEADRRHDRAAKEIAAAPNTYWTDQLNNRDSIAGYHPMGEEIWGQSGGTVDAFVQSIGTAASLTRRAVLRRHKPQTRIVAVEPGESAVLSAASRRAQDRRHRHRLCAADVGPRNRRRHHPGFNRRCRGDWRGVWRRRRACSPALFRRQLSWPRSASGNVLGPEATIATLLVDSGLKYLSTRSIGAPVFRVAR